MAWAENEEGEDGKGLAEEKEEGNACAVVVIGDSVGGGDGTPLFQLGRAPP